MIKPGMKWTDMLRDSARRGLYPDAIGREEEWVNESSPEPHRSSGSRYEADLGNGKWHSISIHPTDLGGFVVTRADISERKRPRRPSARPMRCCSRCSTRARRRPACRPSRARRSIAIRPATSSMATGRASSTTTSIRATATTLIDTLARQGPARRIPGPPIRRRRQCLLGVDLCPADRIPGSAR